MSSENCNSNAASVAERDLQRRPVRNGIPSGVRKCLGYAIALPAILVAIGADLVITAFADDSAEYE